MPEHREHWGVAPARALADHGVGRVVDEFLARAADHGDGAEWTCRVPEAQLRARAATLDAAPRAERDTLPLFGVPFAVKDNIDVAGLATTAGSRAFSYTPGASAPAVQYLLDAGAICTGKTNLDQFATGLTGTRAPDFGICANPIDPDYVTGGSSSGSAALVARGVVPLALGTDTAGSGRVPAACCGVVGLKPTRGRVSTRGVVPASRSFDCVSLFASSCTDVLLAFGVVDDRQPTVAYGRAGTDGPTPDRWRVGVPRTLEWFGDDDAAARFAAAIERVTALGATLVPFDPEPFLEAAVLLYESALVAERFACFGEFVSAHPAAIDPTVREIVFASAQHDAPSVFRALDRLEHVRAATHALWDTIDAIVVPTVARHPTIAEALLHPVEISRELGTYTNFVNLLDLCAVAVPAGARASGLAFGVQFIAPAFRDRSVLTLASSFCGEPAPPGSASPSRSPIAVVGAHLRGQPLNHQLVDLGATFVAATTTSRRYRLYDLATTPPKPGLVRDPHRGQAIEVEVWSLEDDAFGRFVRHVRTPLAIGSVELADGAWVPGFVCEPYACSSAREITAFGGWRAYLADGKLETTRETTS
ncbi:MAG: allophanate hydrolase [Actinomycetota bacterium]|nr:allophanate hydrolase [Actinomycetota bacterium]